MENGKKDRERKILNEFSGIYSEFPPGKKIDSERPDFLIKQNEKIIGIEIVDFIRGQTDLGSIERRNEILRKEIANAARKKYEEKNDTPLIVSFSWKPSYNLRKSEIPHLADCASQIIQKHLPFKVDEKTVIGKNELQNTLLEKVFRSITAWQGRTEKQIQWSYMSCGWTEVQPDEIQSLLDLKNDKESEYLKKCDSVWLIIVADGRYISSDIDIENAVLNSVYKTFFECVFVYIRICNSVFPLRLQKVHKFLAKPANDV